MPVVQIAEFKIQGDNRGTANYDAMIERIGADGNPPEGLIVHTAGWDEEGGVFRIVEVWESAEANERFRRDRLQPALDQGPVNRDDTRQPDRDVSYELHNVVRGQTS